MSRKKEKKQNTDEENYIPKAFQRDSEKELDNLEKKRTNRTRKKVKKKKNKKLRRVLFSIIIIVIVVIGINLGISAHTWKTLANEMLVNKNSIVLDTDNQQIATLGIEKNNETISFEEMPANLKNAYVSIEDERFYSHIGVDIKRTGSAILSYIFHFGKSSYGGSTITQQLVKNLTGDSTDSISRKVKEWWKAWLLETDLSKEEILEAYLNVIYVGPNMYGVETGAKYYFDKTCQDLSLEECAFLAGLNHSPNSYNPFTGEDNAEKIKKRTKTVLSKMLELKYINEENYNTAIANVDNGLHFQKGNITSQEALYSYHTDALILEVTQDIAKKYKISDTFATNYINMAGLTIYSTQNSKIQETTETEFEKSKYSIASKNGGDSSQAAMVIIDNKTGYVLGCTGGLGKKTVSRSLNRATQSIRQTGSSIKPLSVLLPAIDKQIITPASIYDDTERDFANHYHPTDYNSPLGKVTVRRAVESSQNIPFVEIMEQIKPKNSIKYLEKMGISTLTPEDETLVLSLGGLQKGISPLEMAGAYNTIANDGEYIEPTFYSKIDNNAKKTILKTKQDKRRVVSKEVAYIIKEILTQPVNGTHGTATYCKISGVDVAAKTGTTDENYDRWLCGFTPYYTAVTWYGFDQNESIEYNNKNPAGLLWANVMSRIHAGLKSATFEKPNSVFAVTICSKTGKKATTNCPDTYTEYFLWRTVPGLCDEHGGSELKDNGYKDSVQNKVQEVIEGITQDIDAVDPQQVQQDSENTNTNQEPSNQTQSNTTTNTTSNTTTNTNQSTNNSNTTRPSNQNNSTSNNTTTNTTNTATNSTNQSTIENTTNETNSSETTSSESNSIDTN